MKIIGLTGGIGAGKSTVSRYLKTKGYAVIDADEIAKEVVEPGRPALKQLVQQFGDEILMKDGSLDRRKLAAIAFATEEGKNALNRITHGAIFARIDERKAELTACLGDRQDALVFLDAPLLFETGLDQKVDLVWVVDVPDHIRMERIQKRNGWTEEEIRNRMKNQMTRQEKLARADRVLDNSQTEEYLCAQVDHLLAQMGGDAE